MMTAEDIKEALTHLAEPEKAAVLPRFFKTGKGEYGEGDIFLGVSVPRIRIVAGECAAASLELIEELLNHPVHECRSCGLFILVEQFRKAVKDAEKRKRIFDFYISHTSRVNNWDLVDCSAPQIVGEYLKDKPRDLLYRLLDDPLLWNRRIAIVANWSLIRMKDFSEIFPLAERLLVSEKKPHDLLQKACGWMLREVEKYGGKLQLCRFLDRHAATMPHTMLRYAIERMSEAERHRYMNLAAEMRVSNEPKGDREIKAEFSSGSRGKAKEGKGKEAWEE